MEQTHRTNADATIRGEAIMCLENPDMSMDEGEAELVAAGNVILERDDDARTFKVLDAELCVEELVWVCDHCDAYSRSEDKIKRHEATCRGL